MDKTVSFGILDLASELLLQILEYLTVAISCSFVTCNKSTAELKTLYPNFVLWEISAAINEMTVYFGYRNPGPLAYNWEHISGTYPDGRDYAAFWPSIIDDPMYRVLVGWLGPDRRTARHYEILMIFVDEVRGHDRPCGYFPPYVYMDAVYTNHVATSVMMTPREYVNLVFEEVLYMGSTMGPLGKNDDCMSCVLCFDMLRDFDIGTLHCTEEDTKHIRIGLLLAENLRVRQLHSALVQYSMSGNWSIPGNWPPVTMPHDVVEMLESYMSSGAPICEGMGFTSCNHQHECGFFTCPGVVFGKEYTGLRTTAKWESVPKRKHSIFCEKILGMYFERAGK